MLLLGVGNGLNENFFLLKMHLRQMPERF